MRKIKFRAYSKSFNIMFDYDMFISKVDKEKYPNAMQEYRMEFVEFDSK